MFNLTVQELQLAARAAGRWPQGVDGGRFIWDEELEQEFRKREQIEVDRVIGCGCPATEIAARRAKERGEMIVTEREAEDVFGRLISQFYHVSGKSPLTPPDYTELLTNSPAELSRMLRLLAEGSR